MNPTNDTTRTGNPPDVNLSAALALATTATNAGPTTAPVPGRPLNIEQTAALFDVSPRTVMRWMAKRWISYCKFGASGNAPVFFFPEDIAAFAQRFRRNAAAGTN